MLRQPKKDRCYTVEVNIGVREPEIWATNPRDAVVFALKRNGYYVNRDCIILAKDIQTRIIAKVCLLRSKAESVNYYGVVDCR